MQGGLLFLAMLFLGLGEFGGSLPTKFGERNVFAKQSGGAGFYSVLPFVLAASLVDALTVLLKATCYACAIYFLSGFNLGDFGERFAYFILVLFSTSLYVSTYARALSTMSNKDVANALGGVGLIVQIIFSGFLVSKDSIPSFLIWLYWISPIQYAFSALLVNEFRGVRFLAGFGGRGVEGERAYMPARPVLFWIAYGGTALLTIQRLIVVCIGHCVVHFSFGHLCLRWSSRS